MTRPTKDEYFMQMADLAATRSTCLRRKVGAIIVLDDQIVATGYNGAPRKVAHCKYPDQTDDEHRVCIRMLLNIRSGTRHELCRGLHAEQNCIIQAARHGIKIKGGVLYCNFKPCIICTKMIINAGLKEVVYKEDYADDMVDYMVKESNVTYRRFTK